MVWNDNEMGRFQRLGGSKMHKLTLETIAQWKRNNPGLVVSSEVYSSGLWGNLFTFDMFLSTVEYKKKKIKIR